MILKYTILALLALILVTASDPYFGTELRLTPLPPESPDDFRELTWMSTDAFREYLEDKDDRVSDLFKIAPYYYPTVHFWFLIYTQFESSQVVIHDKTNLSLIYKVLDFAPLHHKDFPKNTRYLLQQKISVEKMDEIKGMLDDLAREPYSLSPSSQKIYRMIKEAGIELPLKKSDRSFFFNKLKHNLRSQTGQKDFIRDGILRSLPYQQFIAKFFSSKNLPTELLAIPFLESSFNPNAHSRSNALGVWQFMPLIASYYVPKRSLHADYRSNIGVSSVAAGFLMYENFKIMKAWDLTVTAYNSGTKHLLKTKRELASSDVNLEAIIKHSDSQHFGFASKNFYSEFLALAHVLAYRDDLYPGLHEHDRTDVTEDLRFYLTKCPLSLPRELNEIMMDDIHFHNHHLKDLQNKLPRGFILTAKSKLPIGKFLEISFERLLKVKPKDWDTLIKRQSCSTK